MLKHPEENHPVVQPPQGGERGADQGQHWTYLDMYSFEPSSAQRLCAKGVRLRFALDFEEKEFKDLRMISSTTCSLGEK